MPLLLLLHVCSGDDCTVSGAAAMQWGTKVLRSRTTFCNASRMHEP
jgi:hypothetical protein